MIGRVRKENRSRLRLTFLGLTLDLSSLHRAGVVTLKKQGRESRQNFFKNRGDSKRGQHEFVRSSGTPWPPEFCNRVLFGESLKVCMLQNFWPCGEGRIPIQGHYKKWCEEVLVLLRSVQPRTIPVTINTRTVLIFTDGAWENGIGGLGAVLLDETTGSKLVVQDKVHRSLLDLWADQVGEQLICQIELLAMVLVRWQWMRETS